MQGRSRGQRDVFDVESVAGHLSPAGSVFGFLAEQRGRLFPSEMFEDLFPSGRGRPSIPPDVVATVIVLQTLNGLSDREAAEAVTFDLRWKAACGIAIDAAALAREVVKPRSGRSASASGAFHIAPDLHLGKDRNTFGVAGSF